MHRTGAREIGLQPRQEISLILLNEIASGQLPIESRKARQHIARATDSRAQSLKTYMNQELNMLRATSCSNVEFVRGAGVISRRWPFESVIRLVPGKA